MTKTVTPLYKVVNHFGNTSASPCKKCLVVNVGVFKQKSNIEVYLLSDCVKICIDIPIITESAEDAVINSDDAVINRRSVSLPLY